jgi:hypothetical protein
MVNKLILVALLFTTTLAVCQKQTGPIVQVRAASYTTGHEHLPIVLPLLLRTKLTRTEITASNHPGQTFMIESDEYYLEPGTTHDAQWGKHEKTIKVRCFVSGYHWGKKDWEYVQFKVVGRGVSVSETPPSPDTSGKPRNDTAKLQIYKDASIGVFADGNPDIRHDGVTLTAVTPGGPADQVGIKAGDVVLSITDHYLFTISELREEISHHSPGTKIAIRYRRYSTINDAFVVVGEVQ